MSKGKGMKKILKSQLTYHRDSFFHCADFCYFLQKKEVLFCNFVWRECKRCIFGMHCTFLNLAGLPVEGLQSRQVTEYYVCRKAEDLNCIIVWYLVVEMNMQSTTPFLPPAFPWEIYGFLLLYESILASKWKYILH